MTTLGVTWTSGVVAVAIAPEVLAAQWKTYRTPRTAARQCFSRVRSAAAYSTPGTSTGGLRLRTTAAGGSEGVNSGAAQSVRGARPVDEASAADS